MAQGSSETAPMALTPSNSPTAKSRETSTRLSRLSIPSPSSNYRALLDGNWDGMSSSSPMSTTSSTGSTSPSSVRRTLSTALRFRKSQSAYHDEEQDVWRCRNCGWQYPNPSPRARQRRHHKKVCEGTLLKQRTRGEDAALGDHEALVSKAAAIPTSQTSTSGGVGDQPGSNQRTSSCKHCSTLQPYPSKASTSIRRDSLLKKMPSGCPKKSVGWCGCGSHNSPCNTKCGEISLHKYRGLRRKKVGCTELGDESNHSEKSLGTREAEDLLQNGHGDTEDTDDPAVIMATLNPLAVTPEKEEVNFGAPEEVINTLKQEPDHEGRGSSEAGLLQGSQREDVDGEVQPSSAPDAKELGVEDDNIEGKEDDNVEDSHLDEKEDEQLQGGNVHGELRPSSGPDAIELGVEDNSAEEGKEDNKVEDNHLDGKEDEQLQGANFHGELQPSCGQKGVELGAGDSKLEERKEDEKVEESHLEGKEDEKIQGGNVYELGAEAATENEPHHSGHDVTQDDPKTENLEDFQPGNNNSIASPAGVDQDGIDHEQLEPSDDHDTRVSESSEVPEAGKQINALRDLEHNRPQEGEDEKVGNAWDETEPQQSVSEIPDDLEDQDQHHGPLKIDNLEEVDPLNDHSGAGHAETRNYPGVVGPDGLNHGVEAAGKDSNPGAGEIASDLLLPKDRYDDKVVQESVGVASGETDNPQSCGSGAEISNFIDLSPLWRTVSAIGVVTLLFVVGSKL